MSSPRERFAELTNVSRETVGKFDTYAELLKKWNKTINLVSTTTLDDVWTRHFLDSAICFQAAPQPVTKWVDMGSGGGFPGAVVAMITAEKAPDMSVTCIEADIRKASFLRSLAVATEIKLSVLSRRIEEAPAQKADIVSARALAPLNRLLDHATRHLKPGGQAVFLKGQSWEKEVEEALETFAFSVKNIQSPTNPSSAILVLGDITRA